MIKLEVDNLSVKRGDHLIFQQISFSLDSGQGLVITGPNGAGKSTLMRAIAGLLPLHTGQIHTTGLSGDETLRTSMHFVSTQNAMKSALSVAENLSFWSQMTGPSWMSPAEALAQFGMSHIHDVPYSDLSTGQKRRVALSRLFLNKRPIWLLDEPTSGLDSEAERLFANILNTHITEGGLLIAATHLALGVNGVRSLRFQEAMR